MLVTPVQATVETTTAEPRPCSLLTACVIEPGTMDDYAVLAPFHYRKGRPQGVRAIYRARDTLSGDTVGVVVYAAPALQLRVRNIVLHGRYKSPIAAKKLNAEMDLLMRTIVHPTYRGIGLAVRLLRETLPLRPRLYVEASAAMGRVSRYHERAGMLAFDYPTNAPAERLLAALRDIMPEEEIVNPSAIRAALSRLQRPRRAMIERELLRFDERMQLSRRNDGKVKGASLDRAIAQASANLLGRPVYYLWRNPESGHCRSAASSATRTASDRSVHSTENGPSPSDQAGSGQ